MIFLLVGAWVQLESPRFVMRTDIPDPKAFLQRIEDDVVDVSDVPQLATMQLPARKRITLIVFKDGAEFDKVVGWDAKNGARYTEREGLSGEEPLRVYATVDVLDKQLTQLAKTSMRAALNDLMEAPPLWLVLGFEAYVSTIKRADNTWLAGTPPPYPAMTGAVPSLDQLMLVQDDYALTGEGEKKRIEMCAWRLTHLLMHGTSADPVSAEWMQHLATWFAAVRAGEDAAAALIKSFSPVDLPALYAAHFTAPKLSVSRSPASARAVDGKPVAMAAGGNALPGVGKEPVALAFATDSVRERRELLKKAGSDFTVVAMQMKNELAEAEDDYGRCKTATPLAAKLLSSPVPRHKQIARKVVMGCNKKPPEAPLYTANTAKLEKPVRVAGELQPDLEGLVDQLRGKKGVVLTRIRVERDGKVSGVFLVRSTLPEINQRVVDNVRAWAFEPRGNRYEFLQPFVFDFAQPK